MRAMLGHRQTFPDCGANMRDIASPKITSIDYSISLIKIKTVIPFSILFLIVINIPIDKYISGEYLDETVLFHSSIQHNVLCVDLLVPIWRMAGQT